MKNIGKEELRQYLNSKEDILLIDVLPQEYFDKKHIRGAVNIPLKNNDKFVEEVEKKAKSKDQKIVVYCKDTECDLSPKAAKKLTDAGFTQVEDYEEGVEGWFADQAPKQAANM